MPKRPPPAPPERMGGHKARAAIFCHCKELGYDDEARRIVAGKFRRDGVESMQGMNPLDLGRMEFHLRTLVKQRQTAQAIKAETHRRERLRKHKRIDQPSGRASDRAKHYLRTLAESYYGAEWEIRLNGFLYRQTGGLMQWDSPTLSARDCWNATEGLKQMLKR
ncbi:MAG: hypothetical protein ACOZB3_02355 [Calditrichota bacterium]